VRPDEDAIRIALVLRDVLLYPLDHLADVFGRLVPFQALAAAALHIYASHAVLHGPQHDVVVKRVAIRHRLDLVARAAGDVDQDRTRSTALFRREYVKHRPGIRSVLDVALDFNARIGSFGLHRTVQLGCACGIDHASHLSQLCGDIGRHRGQ